MSKKEDPFMLKNYRFLPLRRRKYVDSFITQLDETSRNFATLRYVDGKIISQVAEEMGYSDRAVYAYRDRVISLWNLYADQNRLDYHRQRVLNMLKKHQIIKHRKLIMNLNLKRSGLTNSEFKEIIYQLIETKQIKCHVSIPPAQGRRGKIYIFN